ncbi:beta-alanyl-dopamine/carcinine hydrolase isoform X1 [Bacillus rossius redtenbacheri]|uniref:beta-alanyl-dopamine/carcinine hydrolase isoform X1 n=1 Tax=Bacillus rossius redtenbacheri TaxID=93214 RepID=UPI002FDEBB67
MECLKPYLCSCLELGSPVVCVVCVCVCEAFSKQCSSVCLLLPAPPSVLSDVPRDASGREDRQEELCANHLHPRHALRSGLRCRANVQRADPELPGHVRPPEQGVPAPVRDGGGQEGVPGDAGLRATKLPPLFLLHMDEILPNTTARKSNPNPNGCSTVCCNYPEKEFLGHTEDALAEILNNIYFVSAHIIADSPQGRWKVTEEKFTSLCYAGHLPGFTMSYNHHGLVYSVNIIKAKTLASGKTPRHFLTRALLAGENFARAQQILRDAGCGAGDGVSINMTFLRQEGDRLFHNAELAPAAGPGAAESVLSVLTASPHEHMFHANKYLRLKVPEVGGAIVTSSDRRQAAFMKFPVPRSKEDIEAILGDQSDREFSIFREESDDDYVKTVAVGIFDCVARTWSIYTGNPKTSEPVVVLPIQLKTESR